MSSTKDINLFICYNDRFKELRDIYVRSIQHKKILISERQIPDNYESNGFQSKIWYDSIKEKIRLFREYYSTLPNDSIIICSDVDILCMDSDKLVELIDRLPDNYDLFGMKESLSDNQTINGGWLIFRKCDSISNLLDQLLSVDISKYKYADQDVYNNLVKELNIRYKQLDPSQFTMYCYYSDIGIINTVILHFTCLQTPQEKLLAINSLWWNHG